jgi:membrane associated rhomboid family serine protease
MIPIRDKLPSGTRPYVTYAIVGINLAVFVIEIAMGRAAIRSLMYGLGFVPAEFAEALREGSVGSVLTEGLTVLSSAFLHGGILHVLSNMWSLYIFGDNVEARFGHGRFALFYVLSAVAAAMTHVVFQSGTEAPTIGASGAVAGVMGAYVVMFPTARIVALVPVIWIPFFFEIPALIFIGLWFVLQLLSGASALFGDQSYGGVAWWAHIGGFAFALLVHRLFIRKGSTQSGSADGA